MKSSMTDRILGRRYLDLPNQKRVYDRRSDAPLILLIIAFFFLISLKITGFHPALFLRKFPNMAHILQQILMPKWSVLPEILPAIGETVVISLVGTILGALIALPVAAFSSYNINASRYPLFFSRALISMIRSIPTMIMAIVLTLIFNAGSLAGTFAIAVLSFSTVTKMLIESIETLDMRAYESLQSMGANRFRSFWAACMPQILATYISHSLYSLEINLRTASILGYVGAGGIGILMNEKIAWRDYQALGAIIFTLFALVLLIHIISLTFRKRYQS